MKNIYQPSEDSYLLLDALTKKVPILVNKNTNLKVLEIGSGSGVNLHAFSELKIKKENLFACDINPEAVKHCKKLGFNCVLSNLFENIKGKFDLIIFNPPYLPEDIREPQKSRLATTGGKKGGELINKFLKEAKKYLNKNGRIFLLTSSLTKGINFKTYKKKIIQKKKIFFEELCVYEIHVR